MQSFVSTKSDLLEIENDTKLFSPKSKIEGFVISAMNYADILSLKMIPNLVGILILIFELSKVKTTLKYLIFEGKGLEKFF